MNATTTNTQAANTTPNLEALSWLRGMAAWLVVVSHSARALEVPYAPGDEPRVPGWFAAFDLGSLGVAVFFVLSGFTLYWSNAQRVQSRGPALWGFYIRRVFRIWPAFAVSLLAYGAFRGVFQAYYGPAQGHWVEAQFLMPVSWADWLAYATLVFNITGPADAFNNAYWSLPVEFQYYLVFPLVVWLMQRLGPWVTLVLGALAYLLFRSRAIPMDSALVLQLMFTFLGGMLLCYGYRRWGLLFKPRPVRIALGAIALALACASTLLGQGLVPLEFYKVIPSEWLFYGLCAVGIVGAVVFSDARLPKPLKQVFLRSGDWSYSLYLYHNLVVGLAVLVLVGAGVQDGLVRFVVLLALVFPFSFMLAWASHRWVEEPGIRLGRYLAGRVVSGKEVVRASPVQDERL